MTLRKSLATTLLLAVSAAPGWVLASCDFDADSADGLDFADRIIDCEETSKPERQALPAVAVEKLYSEVGSAEISEHRVVAPGSLNHTANRRFEAREEYSLRADASFESSVTLAVQRLHLQMAHHCSRGWELNSQRSQAKRDISDPLRSGKYFLIYQFTCSDER